MPGEKKSPVEEVVLACGEGMRLGVLVDGKHPKALLPVCNRAMLGYPIEELRQGGFGRVAVVCG